MNVTERAGHCGNTWVISKTALVNISHVTFLFFPVMFLFAFSRRFGLLGFFFKELNVLWGMSPFLFQLASRLRRVVCSTPDLGKVFLTEVHPSSDSADQSVHLQNVQQSHELQWRPPAPGTFSLTWPCVTWALLSRGACHLFPAMSIFRPLQGAAPHHTALGIRTVSPRALGPRFMHVSDLVFPELETTVFYYSCGLFLTPGR